MKYFIGDFAKVRSNENQTLIFDVNFYDSRYLHFPILELEIIGLTPNNYVLLVPETIDTDLLKISPLHVEKYQILNSLFYQTAILLSEFGVGGRRPFNPYLNPVYCKLCLQSSPYSSNNQLDDSFVCWSCKSTKGYLLE